MGFICRSWRARSVVNIHYGVLRRIHIHSVIAHETFVIGIMPIHNRHARLILVKAPLSYPGNFCRTFPISAQGSFLRCFFELSSVNWLPAVVRGSASHVTGMEIGAPARARVE
jgi:hypothetical protein